MKIDQHMSEIDQHIQKKQIYTYKKYNVDKATCATYYILIAYLRSTYIIEYQSNQNT